MGAGVGAYTGNAIASIACSEGVAVVDANVVRVIARLRCMAGDPRAAAKEHAALADMLLDPERPGCFNQVAPRCPVVVVTASLHSAASRETFPSLHLLRLLAASISLSGGKAASLMACLHSQSKGCDTV